MPRARVHGQDQGQSARSGSGSEVSGEESEARAIPRARVQDQGLCRVLTGSGVKGQSHTQGQSAGSGAGFKVRIQGSRSEFKGQGRTLSQSEGKYRSRLSISIKGQQSKIMTIPRARVQDQGKGNEG